MPETVNPEVVRHLTRLTEEANKELAGEVVESVSFRVERNRVDSFIQIKFKSGKTFEAKMEGGLGLDNGWYEWFNVDIGKSNLCRL